MVWMCTAVVAILIALDKSLIPGASMLGIGLLASVMDAREASGVTLALLIVADWTAIWAYRKNVSWKTLWRLFPAVVLGVVLGAWFLYAADTNLTKHFIGIILFCFSLWMSIKVIRGILAERSIKNELDTQSLVSAKQAERKVKDSESKAGNLSLLGKIKNIFLGAAAGFTTMVANAGGPVTALYFMNRRFPVRLFLGTTAWFYLIVNLIKLPFSLRLGLLTRAHIPLILMGIPIIIIVVACGRWASGRINQIFFNLLVLLLTFVTSFSLIF